MNTKIKSILLIALELCLCYGLLGYFYSKLELPMPVGSSSVIYVFVLLSFVLWFMKQNATKTVGVKNSREEIVLFLFFISCIPSLFENDQYSLTVNSLIYVILPYLSYSTGRYLNSVGDTKLPIHIVIYLFMIYVAIYTFRLFLDSPLDLIEYRDYTFAILATLPFVFLLPRPILRLLLVTIALYLIIISAKRSLIVAYVPSILTFSIITVVCDSQKTFMKKFLSLSVICSFLLVVFFLNDSFVEVSDNMHDRFETIVDDGGSGRDFIYDKIFTEISAQSVYRDMFGNGYDCVTHNIFGHPSHNDFLDILYNHGLIALCLWITFIILLCNKMIKLVKIDLLRGASLISGVVLWFVASMSNCLFVNYIITTMFFLFFGLMDKMEPSKTKSDE